VTRGSDNVAVSIQRTFIARDGRGKAPVNPSKMMLGPCRGSAVRLAAPGDVLMLGEGIETCLAKMLATGYPSWSALSASRLRALDLPDDVRHAIVLADGDDACATASRLHRYGACRDDWQFARPQLPPYRRPKTSADVRVVTSPKGGHDDRRR
jgi:putative DNA primase/helicase